MRRGRSQMLTTGNFRDWHTVVRQVLWCLVLHRDIGGPSEQSCTRPAPGRSAFWLVRPDFCPVFCMSAVLLVLVLVLNESFRTKLQSLFWSLSLMVKSLSLSWSLLPKSLPWSLMKSSWFVLVFSVILKTIHAFTRGVGWCAFSSYWILALAKVNTFASAALVNCEYYFRDYLQTIVCIYVYVSCAIVLGPVLELQTGLVLVLVLGLEGKVLVNITACLCCPATSVLLVAVCTHSPVAARTSGRPVPT